MSSCLPCGAFAFRHNGTFFFKSIYISLMSARLALVSQCSSEHIHLSLIFFLKSLCCLLSLFGLHQCCHGHRSSVHDRHECVLLRPAVMAQLLSPQLPMPCGYFLTHTLTND